MKNKRKIIILTSIIIGVLVVTLGLTYASLSFNQTSGNTQLVLGDIYMHYNETNGIAIVGATPSSTYDENSYFEFTIDGKNTYTEKDIYYEIVLNQGDSHETRTERIRDELLRFTLIEIKEGVETKVVDGGKYSSINNTRIWVNTVPKNTTEEIEITYRLYMWISDETLIGNVEGADYTIDEWNNDIYASIKVNVTGDFNKKVVAENFVSAVKARYGTDTSLVAINTDGDLYDGTGEIREYRYSGPTANNYVYFDTNGDGVKDANEVWRVVGVFKDTVKDEEGNVVNDAEGNPTYEEEVKLVRNTMLQSSEMPTSYLINGTTYTIKSVSYAYWNNVPSGTYPSTNKNDWTTGGLQYYLNTEKDENETANAGYLSYLTEEAKEQISPTTYYLGIVDYNVSTVKLSYNQERDATRLWSGNQASWDGLIGLMYTSDYGYSASNTYWETDMYGWNSAESDGVKASTTSWLYQTANHSTYEWLLSPSSYGAHTAMYWNSLGYVNDGNVGNNYGVRPVLNLKSEAMAVTGAGTSEDPFTVVVG